MIKIEVCVFPTKLEGYIDGKRYYNEKQVLKGYLDGKIHRDSDGYPLLILRDDGVITRNSGSEQGLLKDGKVCFLDGEVLLELKKEDKKILTGDGELGAILEGDLSDITDIDFFGITGCFFDLFSQG